MAVVTAPKNPDLSSRSTLQHTAQPSRACQVKAAARKRAMSKRHLGRRGWEGIQNLPTPKSQKQTLLRGAFGELPRGRGPNLHTSHLQTQRRNSGLRGPGFAMGSAASQTTCDFHRFSSCNQAAKYPGFLRTCMAMLKLLLRKAVLSSKQQLKQAKPAQNQFAENRA